MAFGGRAAVTELWARRETADSTRAVLDAVEALRARGVEGVILGCTELPLLLQEHMEAPDLVNPAQLLAEATVRHAL